jgi:hypothetical protein
MRRQSWLGWVLLFGRDFIVRRWHMKVQERSAPALSESALDTTLHLGRHGNFYRQ